MKTLFLISVSFALGSLGALAARADGPIGGTGYEKGSNHATVLFNFTRTETKSGHVVTVDTKFMDTDGKLLVEEKAVSADDGRAITNYNLDRPQTGESGSLAVHDGKVAFSWTKNGKTETDSEDAKPNLIIGPSTVPYLFAHWTELMNGQDVSTRYAALDRKETVGFKFFKMGETTVDGKPAVQIKMKPQSFVIAAIVDPLIFTFDKEGKHLLELEGRALPKRKDGDKWKDLDADIVYKFQ